MPLWGRFATAGELKRLLSEGRATLGAKKARDGLGFARAIAALGVDRGITAFQRYGFLMRSGKAYLATPLSRVEVRSNPKAELIEDLESGGFLDRLRRFVRSEHAPAGIRSQVRRLEDALFTLTRHSDKDTRQNRDTLQKILWITGRICLSLSKSSSGREAVPRLPRLKTTWVQEADDGSPEFRYAAALAALSSATAPDHTKLPLLPFILPTDRVKGGWQWEPGSRRAVWHEGGLTRNLCDIITRRHIEGFEVTGATSRAGAGTADLQGFFDAGLDEKRLAELLLGLILADIPTNPFAAKDAAKDPVPLPAGYLVLKPLFTPHVQLVQLGFLAPDRTLPWSGEMIANLRANHTQRALDLGWCRLRASGVSIPDFPRHAPAASGIDGPRLLATLSVPLNSEDLFSCLKALNTKLARTPEYPEGEPA